MLSGSTFYVFRNPFLCFPETVFMFSGSFLSGATKMFILS